MLHCFKCGKPSYNHKVCEDCWTVIYESMSQEDRLAMAKLGIHVAIGDATGRQRAQGELRALYMKYQIEAILERKGE